MQHRALRNLFASTLVVGLVSVSGSAFAQLVPGTPYQLSRAPITYQPLSNPTVLFTDADDSTASVTLPFPMVYYGTTLTSIGVGSNGAIAFPGGTNVSLSNRAPGASGAPAGVIAPYWADLRLYSGANNLIGYQVEGTAPSRTLTVEWRNVSFYPLTATALNMQVRFFEGQSARIEIDYGSVTGSDNDGATMGMDNPMNAQPILFTAGGCTNDCLAADWPTNTRVTVVQDPGVELLAESITAPELGFLGAQTQVPVTVRNLHGMPIGPFTVEVVASQTTDLANAVVIGTAQMTLPAFGVETINVTTIPPQSLGEGSVYLGLRVDSTGVITEADETNNTAVSRTQIRLLTGSADLAVLRVRAASTTVNAGSTVDVTVTVQNVGGEPAPATDIAIMLSTNPVISAQDVLLGTYSVTLAAGETDVTVTPIPIDAMTNSGTYYIGALADPMHTLDELSESNNGLADDSPLVVAGGALAIATTRLPQATLNASYNALLRVVGGDAQDRTYAITQGSLPTGIQLSPSSGEFFGRATNPGVSTFTVEVTSGGETATRQLMLTVNDPAEPLTIVSRRIAPAVVGQEYVFPLIVTGRSASSSVAWSATGLPDGFAISASGTLTGTPQVAGTSTITVTAMAGQETATRDLLLEVRDNANLLIVPSVLPGARFGEAYSAQLESTGGLQPILWTFDRGTLPPGLSISTMGLISGTPSEAGSYTFVVAARDSSPGNPARDVNTFEIVVADNGGLTISTPNLPDAIVNQSYEALIEVMGGTAPYTWTIPEGRVPEGILANANTNTTGFALRGQAAEVETRNFLVEVRDADGRTAVRAFSLRVVTAPPVIEPVDEGGCSCAAAPSTSRGGLAALALLGVVLLRRRRR